MKTTVLIIIGLFLFGSIETTEAQLLRKLKKRAEEAAKETILQKVEEKAAEKTGTIMDTILDADKKLKKKKKSIPSENHENGSEDNDLYEDEETLDTSSLEVYSKFDFVPGDTLLLFDDFSEDYIGDFPSKWNTNGSGELVEIGNNGDKWLQMRPGYNIFYIPDLPNLPEDYTIEFDLLADGIDQKTSSTAVLRVGVSDNNSFTWGNRATVDIPFCQYAPVGFFVRNGGDINTSIQGDIRENVLYQPHISIAVNKQRFRLWVDEGKYVDIPRMIPSNTKPTTLKFELLQFKDGKERLFIRNLKVVEGGVDLRKQLIEKGRFSTNGILFDSGSATIQPQSYGIIRQISQALQQDESMHLNIIGHTDADGSEETNLILSKNRAESVKEALIKVYNISGERLETEGKGESQPVADNSTTQGKAKNRRVEFIKI
ncbi:OmpA family protein [Sabulilitoribacter multivorans]|uniref:OmpA family protein n=1 Tax=Flaviramulus multivorans TaxID=1304750 RepID=A0ABS9IL75_9FLAO|nr:OmpA family protein [Flaviramulus multivorans]MCF7561341.1 OmpA family protein [Flaviramulus multivorans]